MRRILWGLALAILMGNHIKAQVHQLENLHTFLAEVIDEDDQRLVWAIYYEIAVAHENSLAFDSAQYYYDVQMAHTKKHFADTAQTRLLAKVYQNIGVMHLNKGDLDQALVYADSSIDLFMNLERYNDAALVQGNRAMVYINKGQPERAISIYEELLNLADGLDDEVRANQLRESAYSNICKVYIDQSDWDRALTYAERNLEVARTDEGKGIAHLNLSTAHAQLDSNDLALYHIRKADSLFAPLKNPYYRYTVDVNLAEIYHKEGDYQEELPLLDNIESLSTQYDDAQGLYFATNARGRTLGLLGRYNEAKENLKRAEVYANQLPNKTYLRTTLQNLSEVYARSKEYKPAFEYGQRFYELDSALQFTEKRKALDEMLTRFESEKKDRELAEQNAEIIQKASENRLLLIGLSAVLVLSVAFYYLYRSRKRAELQVALIHEQEKGLEAVFEATEEERKRIAKDLHDGVGQQLSALKRGFEELVPDLGTVESERLNGLKTLVDETATDTREISHRMMPRVLMELGLVPAIDDLLNKTLKHTSIQHRFEHYKLKERYDERKEIALFRILQELVNNVIKHSGANEVDIQLMEIKNKLTLTVEDNGKGLNEENEKGLGMTNIKNRLNILKGNVDFEPSPNAGTVARVSIPVS